MRNWADGAGVSPRQVERILRGVYRREFGEFGTVAAVPARVRSDLAAAFDAWPLPTATVFRSADGTRKLLFAWPDGSAVETVLIPDRPRQTVCVSSQVGCAMGCRFCATGRLGLRRNLSASEIVGQVRAADRLLGTGERITNVVFMGMGEPLQNYAAVVEAVEVLRADWGFGLSGRRITVSTVGLLPQLERLMQETDVSVAISLTAAEDQLRERLMPVNRRYPLADIADACRRVPLRQRRRIVFEYVLLAGTNDSARDACDLVDLLRGIRAKVNLIPFNPYPGCEFRRPTAQVVSSFQSRLLAAGISATVRRTRGAGVHAACGQLAAVRDCPDAPPAPLA